MASPMAQPNAEPVEDYEYVAARDLVSDPRYLLSGTETAALTRWQL